MQQTGPLIAAVGFAALIAVAPLAQALPAPPASATAPPAPVYEMETLTTAALAPAVVKQLEPLHTLQSVETLLKENYIPFTWAHRQVPTSALPPDLISQLNALPAHEVFVVKQGDGALIGVILSKH